MDKRRDEKHTKQKLWAVSSQLWELNRKVKRKRSSKSAEKPGTIITASETKVPLLSQQNIDNLESQKKCLYKRKIMFNYAFQCPPSPTKQ